MAASTSLQRYWSDEEIYKLINLCEEEELLYNSTAKNFKIKDARQAALGRIASNFDNCTGTDVSRKWSILKAQYNKYNRMGMTTKNGSEAGKKFIRWKFYRAMSFLEKYILDSSHQRNLAASISDTTSEMEDTDLDQSELTKIFSHPDEINEVEDEFGLDQREPPPLPDDSMDGVNELKTWTDEENRKLIQLYKTEMYSKTSKQYSKWEARRVVIERIAPHFDCTATDVARKWNIMLSQFNRARKVLRTRGSKVTKKWKHYDAMSFIAKCTPLRMASTLSNANREMVGSVERNNSTSESSSVDLTGSHNGSESQFGKPDPILPNGDSDSELKLGSKAGSTFASGSDTSAKKQQNVDSAVIEATYELVKKMAQDAAENGNDPLDDCTAFANFVGCELRKLDPEPRKRLKGDICTLIFS